MSTTRNIAYLNADTVKFDRLIMAATSEFELLDIVGRVAEFFGFPLFLIIRTPLAEDRSLGSLGIVSNWPEKLVAEYDRLGLFDKSPIMEHLKRSQEPLFFDIKEINAQRDEKQRDEANFLFDGFGLNHGVYFCVHNTRGEVAAVSFAGPDNITDREVFTKLYYYANLIYSRLSVLRTKDDASFFDLKAREIELLQRVSQGYKLTDIADAFDLSEKTVEVYLNNAALKLGCATRIHAVSKALRLNLIR